MARKWRISKRTVIERIRVIGPMDEYKSCMAELHEQGWNLGRSGPYRRGGPWVKCDMTRFLLIAEREIEEPLEKIPIDSPRPGK